MYTSRGLNVTNTHADPKFRCIRKKMLPTLLHIAAAREHAGDVENPMTNVIEESTWYLPTYMKYKEPDDLVLHVHTNVYLCI